LTQPNERTTASSVVPNINAVRGVACLLVAALHVIGDNAESGLHLAMTSLWHYAMISIEFLRIPLFTALSGYLYAGNRVTRGMFGSFWQKKLRRLGIPLVVVSTVVWYLRKYTYGETTLLTHEWFFASGHLWYIQALIINFVIISILDSFCRPGFGALVLTGLASIMVAQAGLTVPTFFSLHGAIYLAPYFLFGILLREQPGWLCDRRSGTLAIGIIIIVLTAQQLGLYGLTNEVTLLQLPAALAGMAGVVFLLQRMPNNPVLAVIGGYSYTIYLWHIVASAAVRQCLIKIGITSLPVLFAFCFIAAIVAPIILHHIARSIPLISVAVTGEKWRRAAIGNRPATALLGSKLSFPPNVKSDNLPA
jgi:glucan biosynthesis protein C